MLKGFFNRIRDAFRKSEITEELYEDLEESLILADVSVQTSTELVEQLRGECGPRQVEGARTAIQVNGGGLWGIEESIDHIGIFGCA